MSDVAFPLTTLSPPAMPGYGKSDICMVTLYGGEVVSGAAVVPTAAVVVGGAIVVVVGADVVIGGGVVCRSHDITQSMTWHGFLSNVTSNDAQATQPYAKNASRWTWINVNNVALLSPIVDQGVSQEHAAETACMMLIQPHDRHTCC